MVKTLEQEVNQEYERFQYHQNFLNDLGIKLNSDSVILDFGCGSGYLVYHYRKRGLKAFGVDIEDSYNSIQSLVQQEQLGDSWPTIFRKIDRISYKIPFEDNTFDFVYSDQVFEHVQNFSEALGEIKRVLKPGGYSLHFFPPKYRIIEGHVGVPFAGVCQGYSYLLFWAFLGIRNPFQKGLNFRQVADLNAEYLKKETNYPSSAEIKQYFSHYFKEVSFVESLAIKHHPKSTRYFYFIAEKISLIPFLARTFQARVIFMRKS